MAEARIKRTEAPCIGRRDGRSPRRDAPIAMPSMPMGMAKRLGGYRSRNGSLPDGRRF